MSVCVSVCLSVTASHFHNSWPILMKLGPHDLNKILRWHFSQILKILIRWRHSGHFICFQMPHSHGRNFASILSKSIDKKLCYWKSAKSVNNFRSKKRTAFSKNRLFCFRACVGGPWFDPRFGQNFFNLNFSSCDREWFLLCEKHRKWLNILLTLWCSCSIWIVM